MFHGCWIQNAVHTQILWSSQQLRDSQFRHLTCKWKWLKPMPSVSSMHSEHMKRELDGAESKVGSEWSKQSCQRCSECRVPPLMQWSTHSLWQSLTNYRHTHLNWEVNEVQHSVVLFQLWRPMNNFDHSNDQSIGDNIIFITKVSPRIVWTAFFQNVLF
jgi:hypothetical protein